MRARIALIQPITSLGKSLGVFKSPESIQALAGELKKLGYEVKMFHAPNSDELHQNVYGFRPDVVCISTITANFPEGRKIAQTVKTSGCHRQVKIILGGWHASGCVKAYEFDQERESLQEILNHNSPFDYVVAGEGEEVLPKLLEVIKINAGISHLKGVSNFSSGKIHMGGSTPRVDKPGKLAMPSWESLDVDQYRDKRNGNLDLSVHFNRGCRFKCAYCATASVYGRGIRTTPTEQALEYIEYLAQKFSPQVITFTDEDFFANLPWVKRLVQLLRQKNFHQRHGIEFDTFASVNDLFRLQKNGQGRLLDQMKSVGFNSFTIGIESFNPKTLVKFNKELMILPTMNSARKESYCNLSKQIGKLSLLQLHYFSTVQQAIKFAHEHGFIVIGDYILSNLGESIQQVRDGFRLFKSLRHLMAAYLPVYTPFPGTALWPEAYMSGQLARKYDGGINWEKFDASGGALDLGYDTASLRNELEIEFYTSDRYSRDMLAMLKKNLALKKFFLDRLNYLDQLYPDDPRIIKQLARLQ